MPTANQTLGRGKVYFNRFVTGTLAGPGERYIGNTTEITMTTAVETLDHYSSDSGVREKDISVETQRNRTLRITTDDISAENIALLLGSDAQLRATAGITDDGDTLTVQQGLYYQLGTRASRPEGVRNVTNVIVRDNSGVKASGTLTFSGQPSADGTLTINGHVITFKASGATGAQVNLGGTATLTAQAVKSYINDHPDETQVIATGASTVLTLTAVTAGVWGNSLTLARSGSYPALSGATLTSGADGAAIPSADNWTVDAALGRLYIEEDGQIADGSTIAVTYDVTAHSQSIVISENQKVEGALRFIADNPRGTNRMYFWPYVQMSPDGDLALKGDTWLSITLRGEVMTLNANTKQVYTDA
jgi:hypothetical protein